MKIDKVAGTRSLSGEPPRSTAYYYADIERMKRKNTQNGAQELQDGGDEPRQNASELSEYVESNEVIKDGAVREVPPLRDRVRQWSLPEYTPEPSRKLPEETYSTAGTFPMPEPKEKEPLLAELEVVGRLPLTQLESTSGVRRSRSWYLCCPNVPDEDISRESSWRYSSLRPVTAPPMPGQNGMHFVVATQSSRGDDAGALRAERDALVRALAAERQRAATAARAHDARLAELHGVIAELVRRRAADKHTTAIPEEEVSDECESTTQPAGELDNDADRSRTDQNDTSSLLSPAELPTPQEPKASDLPAELPEDTTDTSNNGEQVREENPLVQVSGPCNTDTDYCDTSLKLSEKDSEICVHTARCCQYVRGAHSGDSCEREHGSADGRVYTASPGRCESRQAKIASRVRLRRTEEADSKENDDTCNACVEAAERLALDVCAQADLREALVAAATDNESAGGRVCVWRAKCARLAADCRVLQCALSRATDTAHRLSCACAVQESSCVTVCAALRAADRALEVYDVLLALAETSVDATDHEKREQREAAELVAKQLLARLEMEQNSATIGEPLLSPGPWLQHDHQAGSCTEWSVASETRLRRHAARLKSDTVALRSHGPTPQLFSYHDVDEDLPQSTEEVNMAAMEAAVTLQEVLSAREARLARSALGATEICPVHEATVYNEHKDSSYNRRRERERHWLAAETDL